MKLGASQGCEQFGLHLGHFILAHPNSVSAAVLQLSTIEVCHREVYTRNSCCQSWILCLFSKEYSGFFFFLTVNLLVPGLPLKGLFQHEQFYEKLHEVTLFPHLLPFFNYTNFFHIFKWPAQWAPHPACSWTTAWEHHATEFWGFFFP